METTSHHVTPELADRLASYSDPAILLSPDYRIVEINAVYRRVYGDIDLSTPKHCHEVFHGYLLPCHEAGEECPLKNCLNSGQPQRAVHVHNTPRGKEHLGGKVAAPVFSRIMTEALRHLRVPSEDPSAPYTTVGRETLVTRRVTR